MAKKPGRKSLPDWYLRIFCCCFLENFKRTNLYQNWDHENIARWIIKIEMAAFGLAIVLELVFFILFLVYGNSLGFLTWRAGGNDLADDNSFIRILLWIIFPAALVYLLHAIWFRKSLLGKMDGFSTDQTHDNWKEIANSLGWTIVRDIVSFVIGLFLPLFLCGQGPTGGILFFLQLFYKFFFFYNFGLSYHKYWNEETGTAITRP